MPRRDGTGPNGAGSMTGRGLGNCTDVNAVNYRAGFGSAYRRGFGRGFGRGFNANQNSTRTQKELLCEQKAMLQEQLEAIEKQLHNL